MSDYSDIAKLFQTGGQSWAVPYTAGSGTGVAAPSTQPSWWGNAVGSETLAGDTGGGFDERLTKALGQLGQSKVGQQAQSSGGGQLPGTAPAQSATGSGRAPSLDTLMQLLNQRFQGMYPGGGGGKGLLGV